MPKRNFSKNRRRFYQKSKDRGYQRKFYKNRRKVVYFDPSDLIKLKPSKTKTSLYQIKNSFNGFDIDNNLKNNIFNRGFKKPTPIQDRVIPYLLKNKDVVGIASTGTGKTAAFLIPLINKAILKKSEKILIMAPTRELAIQINSEYKLFSKNSNIYSSLCTGGTSMRKQIFELKRNPNFVIATPGRLIDLEKRNHLNLNSFSSIVLDEVDQMFDMGFIKDIKYIIEKLPQERHSLFFSATLSKKINNIVDKFLSNPVKIKDEEKKIPENVKQDIIKVNGQSKTDLLYKLLNKESFNKVLVFGRTKNSLDDLGDNLYKRGLKTAIIHGNKRQNQRKKALKQFKENQVSVLLATDVASRGLDIDNVSHVINFDLPETYEDYVHRIGRTGRANKTGVALSFVK